MTTFLDSFSYEIPPQGVAAAPYIYTVLTRPRLFVCVNLDFCVTTEFKVRNTSIKHRVCLNITVFLFHHLLHSPPLIYNFSSILSSPPVLVLYFFCPRTSFIRSRLQLCAGVFPHYDSSVYSARVERHPISRLGAPATRRVLPPLGNHGNHTTLCPVCVTEESTGRT